MQVQRTSDDNLNDYHVVPNHVHAESNGFSSIEDSLYISSDTRYFSGDDKENNFLNLESDSEDTDQLAFALSDFPSDLIEADMDTQEQCFDLSLDSDTELEECEETLELQWDDCDEGDDLVCSMQEQQCENNMQPSGDQLVYKIPEISSLSLNNFTDFDKNNEICMDLSPHDDLSSATVEVIAVSMQDRDVKDIVTTSGVVMVDQLCSAATTVCFASSQNISNEDVCSPVDVTIKTELRDDAEHKQEKHDSLVTHPNIDAGEKESKCMSVLLEEAHHLPMEDVSYAK